MQIIQKYANLDLWTTQYDLMYTSYLMHHSIANDSGQIYQTQLTPAYITKYGCSSTTII